MTAITGDGIKKIIGKLLSNQDYGVEINELAKAQFLEFAIGLFRRVVHIKLKKESVTSDWYQQEFQNTSYLSGVSLQRTVEYNDQPSIITGMIESEKDLDLTLNIKFRSVSVDLTLSESLIVINTLAVKRAELRGGAWSTAGKQVEKSLMKTLCLLYEVPEAHYDLTGLTDSQREVDFYLIGRDRTRYRCEVKLMGKGNPESADAIFARESQVFVGDKLSDLNKQQAEKLKVKWVELRSPNGYQKFKAILDELDVPNADFKENIDPRLEKVFSEIFK